MIRLKITAALIVIASFSSFGQIKTGSNISNTIANENPFLDVSDYSEYPNNVGKGLVFPRTDLTTWTFKIDNLDGITFPTAFDGMIVYNTGTGSTVTGQGQQVSVTPGFYYFYNPGASDNIANGEWLKFEAGNVTGGKFVDGTDPADAVYTIGKVGIGTDSPSNKLTVKGDDAIQVFENGNGDKKFAILYSNNDPQNEDTGEVAGLWSIDTSNPVWENGDKALVPQIRVVNTISSGYLAIDPGVGDYTSSTLQGGVLDLNTQSGPNSTTNISTAGGQVNIGGTGTNVDNNRQELTLFKVYSDKTDFSSRLTISEIRDYNNSSFKSSAAISFPGITTAGILPPKLTNTQISNIVPQAGLFVYSLTENCLMYFNNSQWVCSDGSGAPLNSNINIANLGTTLLPTSSLCGDKTISVTGCGGVTGTTLNTTTPYGATYDWNLGSTYMSSNTEALVEINGQCWFAQNVDVNLANPSESAHLATIAFPDDINQGENVWNNLSNGQYYDLSGAWGYFNESNLTGDLGFSNTPSLTYTFGEGILYQWKAAMNGSTVERAQGVCPNGFHIPSDCEWMFLEKNLGMSNSSLELEDYRGATEKIGVRLKSVGDPDVVLNESKFSSLDNGLRIGSGNFQRRNVETRYITSTLKSSANVFYRHIYKNLPSVRRIAASINSAGSLRCLRN